MVLSFAPDLTIYATNELCKCGLVVEGFPDVSKRLRILYVVTYTIDEHMNACKELSAFPTSSLFSKQSMSSAKHLSDRGNWLTYRG